MVYNDHLFKYSGIYVKVKCSLTYSTDVVSQKTSHLSTCYAHYLELLFLKKSAGGTIFFF